MWPWASHFPSLGLFSLQRNARLGLGLDSGFQILPRKNTGVPRLEPCVLPPKSTENHSSNRLWIAPILVFSHNVSLNHWQSVLFVCQQRITDNTMNEKVGNAVNGKNLRMGDHIWIDGLLVSGDFVDVVLYYTITLVFYPTSTLVSNAKFQWHFRVLRRGPWDSLVPVAQRGWRNIRLRDLQGSFQC